MCTKPVVVDNALPQSFSDMYRRVKKEATSESVVQVLISQRIIANTLTGEGKEHPANAGQQTGSVCESSSTFL